MPDCGLETLTDGCRGTDDRNFTQSPNIGETLAHVVEHMATKEDLAQLRTELKADIKDVRTEVTSIRRDLDQLSQNVENMIGYSKEIDHALERIAAIEKHLGINKKIAA